MVVSVVHIAIKMSAMYSMFAGVNHVKKFE